MGRRRTKPDQNPTDQPGRFVGNSQPATRAIRVVVGPPCSRRPEPCRGNPYMHVGEPPTCSPKKIPTGEWNRAPYRGSPVVRSGWLPCRAGECRACPPGRRSGLEPGRCAYARHGPTLRPRGPGPGVAPNGGGLLVHCRSPAFFGFLVLVEAGCGFPAFFGLVSSWVLLRPVRLVRVVPSRTGMLVCIPSLRWSCLR